MIWLVGLLSGFILNGFLYIFELWLHIPVHTLLMNVDYFPVLGKMHLPNWVELSLHLIVSICVVWILYFILKKRKREQNLLPYLLFNGVIALVIFPTTILSDRTPEVDNIAAWIIWLLGHLVYGFFVWWMLKGLKERKK
ncbi:hypothetical protein [Oceanobacillus sp. J11TS1]|uniref:hypothetical protein n=1 Tax=Oceanobacillus sp. J11TS1 TaxID=2807191 RepID=UPI001BB30E2C|nr:hypothetical protein [Oceanobacillus sp. J11TS1]